MFIIRGVFRGPLRLLPFGDELFVLIFNVKNYAKIWTFEMYAWNVPPSDLEIRHCPLNLCVLLALFCKIRSRLPDRWRSKGLEAGWNLGTEVPQGRAPVGFRSGAEESNLITTCALSTESLFLSLFAELLNLPVGIVDRLVRSHINENILALCALASIQWLAVPGVSSIR